MSTATLASPATNPVTATYHHALGYLRAFLVVLVVAHHAALAYHPYAPPPSASLIAEPRWWGAFPIVDPQKWSGATLLVGFNDTFFMSLMFFLSGLFVWQSLAKKGATAYLRDRLFRLGLPFLIAAGVLAPLAYYPTYLQTSGHSGVAGFVHQWLSLGNWPAGPAWFIWVLLVFDCIAAIIFVRAPGPLLKLAAFTSGAARRPFLFFAALVVVSALAYLPMAHQFTSLDWTSFGPFTFQTSRIAHYFVYFLAGVAVGAASLNYSLNSNQVSNPDHGLDSGFLSPTGKLARRWPLWLAASLICFVAASVATIAAMANWGKSPALAFAMDAGFVLSCAASCFAFLALFLRFARSRSHIWDSLAASSYGIYLIHYAVLTWMQYTLLPAAFPGIAKWLIAFPGALALSWATTATLRRIPSIAKVI